MSWRYNSSEHMVLPLPGRVLGDKVIFFQLKTWSWPSSTLFLTTVGYPPIAVGYPPTAVGYSPTAVSYPPAAVGCTPTAVGYLPTAVGYPPTAVGCTPTAVGYPLSAIGWSCADFADHRTNQLFFFEFKKPPAHSTFAFQLHSP